MTTRWCVIQAEQAARYDELPLTNVSLFAAEDFSGCLLGFLPGQILAKHRHEHEHEVFDVLSGNGTVWLDGQPILASAGTALRIPVPNAG